MLPSFRDAVAARLKFANEYSQSKRFTELFDVYASVLELLVPSPIELVKPVIDTRKRVHPFWTILPVGVSCMIRAWVVCPKV